MPQTQQLFDTLKHALKAHKRTYADVAGVLQLSEASVKRLFAEKKLSLLRLEQVCQMLDMEISDLVQMMNQRARQITQLTREQEEEIAGDRLLLLVTVCALNRWTLAQMLNYFRITEFEAIRCLARLDRQVHAAQRLNLGVELMRRYYTGWGYAGHWDGHGDFVNPIVYPFWLVGALHWAMDTRDPASSTHGYIQGVMYWGPFRKELYGRSFLGDASEITWDHMRGIGERVYGRGDTLDPLSGYEGKELPGAFHGLRSVATRSHQNTTRLVDGLTGIDGVERLFEGPCFHEVALKLDRPVGAVLEALAEQDILGGYDLSVSYPDIGNALLVCATETKTDADIDPYVSGKTKIMSAAARRSA